MNNEHNDIAICDDLPGKVKKSLSEVDPMPADLKPNRNQRRIAKKKAKKAGDNGLVDVRKDLSKTHKSFGELIGTYGKTLTELTKTNDVRVKPIMEKAIGLLDDAVSVYESAQTKIEDINKMEKMNEDVFFDAFAIGNNLIEDIQKLNNDIHPLIDEAFEIMEEKEELTE